MATLEKFFSSDNLKRTVEANVNTPNIGYQLHKWEILVWLAKQIWVKTDLIKPTEEYINELTTPKASWWNAIDPKDITLVATKLNGLIRKLETDIRAYISDSAHDTKIQGILAQVPDNIDQNYLVALTYRQATLGAAKVALTTDMRNLLWSFKAQVDYKVSKPSVWLLKPMLETNFIPIDGLTNLQPDTWNPVKIIQNLIYSNFYGGTRVKINDFYTRYSDGADINSIITESKGITLYPKITDINSFFSWAKLYIQDLPWFDMTDKKWSNLIEEIDNLQEDKKQEIMAKLHIFTGKIDEIEKSVRSQIETDELLVNINWKSIWPFKDKREKAAYLTVVLYALQWAVSDIDPRGSWYRYGWVFMLSIIQYALLPWEIFNPTEYLWWIGVFLDFMIGTSVLTHWYKRRNALPRYLWWAGRRLASQYIESSYNPNTLPENYKARVEMLDVLINFYKNEGADPVIVDKLTTLKQSPTRLFANDGFFYWDIAEYLIDAHKWAWTRAGVQVRRWFYRGLIIASHSLANRTSLAGVDLDNGEIERGLLRNLRWTIKEIVESIKTNTEKADLAFRSATKPKAEALIDSLINDASERASRKGELVRYLNSIDSGSTLGKWTFLDIIDQIVNWVSRPTSREIDETRQIDLRTRYDASSESDITTEWKRRRLSEKLRGKLAHRVEIWNPLTSQLNSSIWDDKLDEFAERIKVIEWIVWKINQLVGTLTDARANLIERLRTLTISWNLDELKSICEKLDSFEHTIDTDVEEDVIRRRLKSKIDTLLEATKATSRIVKWIEELDIEKEIELEKSRFELEAEVAKVRNGDIKVLLSTEVTGMDERNVDKVKKLVMQVAQIMAKTSARIVVENNDVKVTEVYDEIEAQLKKLSSQNIDSASTDIIIREVLKTLDFVHQLDKVFNFDGTPTKPNIPWKLLDLILKTLKSSTDIARFKTLLELSEIVERLEEAFAKKTWTTPQAREAVIQDVDRILEVQKIAAGQSISDLLRGLDEKFGVAEAKVELERKINAADAYITAAQKRILLARLSKAGDTDTIDGIETDLKKFERIKEIFGRIETTEIPSTNNLREQLENVDLVNLKSENLDEFIERLTAIEWVIERLKQVWGDFTILREKVVQKILQNRGKLEVLSQLNVISDALEKIENSLKSSTLNKEIKKAFVDKIISLFTERPDRILSWLKEIYDGRKWEISEVLKIESRLSSTALSDSEYDDVTKIIRDKILEWILADNDVIISRLNDIVNNLWLDELVTKINELQDLEFEIGWETKNIKASEILMGEVKRLLISLNNSWIKDLKEKSDLIDKVRTTINDFEDTLVRLWRWKEGANHYKSRLERALTWPKIDWWTIQSTIKSIEWELDPLRTLLATKPLVKGESLILEEAVLQDYQDWKLKEWSVAQKTYESIRRYIVLWGTEAQLNELNEYVSKDGTADWVTRRAFLEKVSGILKDLNIVISAPNSVVEWLKGSIESYDARIVKVDWVEYMVLWGEKSMTRNKIETLKGSSIAEIEEQIRGELGKWNDLTKPSWEFKIKDILLKFMKR